jgi:hydrogenase maturation protease
MSCDAIEASPAGRPRTLIIGYGSPIRGDDAVCPLAADLLGEQELPAEVTVLSRHVLTADLVPDIAAADRVIFLDAALHGRSGEVRCQSIHADRSSVSTMAHFLDPRELLAWADALYDSRPVGYLVSVAGACFEFSSYQLSAAVQRSLPELLERVHALLDPDSGIESVID